MTLNGMIQTVIRKGYYTITEPENFVLSEFDDIRAAVNFECKLERNYFTKGDWVITCPVILDERHNCFWHGQGCDPAEEVSNPTKWMDTWQHKHNPAWRS